MKNRIYLFILLTTLLTHASYGKTVDENAAKQIGLIFLNSIGATGQNIADLTTVYKALNFINGVEVTSFYVFNEKPSWFVIISGDDNLPPILGYSTETLFKVDTTNDNVAQWLQGYQEQIAYAIENNLTPSAATRGKWAQIKEGEQNRSAKLSSVAPLLTTKWNQYPYYNDLCPYDPLLKAHAVTGCVATAMAQLMKYWNWPPIGCGSHTYRDILYGTQTVNFSNANYQWNLMADSLGGPDTAVALLMYNAGVSVNMDYGVGGSGAWVIPGDSMQTNVASYALKSYFHYKSSMIAVARDGDDLNEGFTTAQWVNMLKDELDAGRPVLYAGFNASEGHCWVCDGYESNDSFFHFNWGWGGIDDGYFTLDNLVDGLDGQQEAVFGIMPDSFTVYSGDIQLDTCLNSSSSPTKYGQPFSVCTKIVNKGSNTFNGDFRAQLFDSSDDTIGTIQTINGLSINAGDSTPVLTFATNGMYNLGAGIYSMRILYRYAGTNTWIPIANNGNYINYSVMGIADDTDIMIYRPFDIAMDTLIHGMPVTIKAYVTDIGRSRFTGNLDMSLYDINSGAEVYNIGRINNQLINTYSEYQYTFSDSELTVPPGKYILMLEHQYNDTGNYYITGSSWMPNPIVVTVGGVKSYNSSNIYVYPNPATNIVYIDPYQNVLNEVRLIDIQGREIRRIGSIQQNTSLSMSLTNVPPGLYFLELISPDKIDIRKIIVLY